MVPIKLYQYRRALSVPNASPFCMKVETFLRMADLDYEVVTVMDPRKSPKGKLPYIVDDGKKIPDSGIILNYLTKRYRLKIDQDLSEKDRAIGLAFTRMMEEHFYWTLVYSRFLDSSYAHVSHKVFFGKYPWPIRAALAMMVSRKVKETLYHQGIGRHSEKEIYQMAEGDLRAVSEFLGDKDFFFGKKPRSADAAVFSGLATATLPERRTPLHPIAEKFPNLKRYAVRMLKKYFPEYPLLRS